MSHLPAVVAAHARLTFPEVQDHESLESFFLDLSLSLFESSSTNGKLIGHIKLYGEGKSKSVIRANVTGRRESLQVEIRNFQPEKEVKVWLNIIAYKRSEDELRRKFFRTITQTTKEHKVKLQGLRIAQKHDHDKLFTGRS